MKLSNLTPVLRVRDARLSESFYERTLGFKKEWEHQFGPEFPLMMSIKRDNLIIFLSEHAGTGCDECELYLNADDIDAFYNEHVAQGVLFEKAPVDEPWGMRETILRDPDRHRITIGVPLS